MFLTTTLLFAIGNMLCARILFQELLPYRTFFILGYCILAASTQKILTSKFILLEIECFILLNIYFIAVRGYKLAKIWNKFLM